MESSTIQISNLGTEVTDAQLEEVFSDFGPLKRCFAVRPKTESQKVTKGIVQFSMSEDVDRLFEDTDGHIKTENGLALSFTRISDDKQKGTANPGQGQVRSFEQKRFDRQQALKKKARLIVRNLSFKATEEKLQSHFSTYGSVVDCNILKKRDGKMVGCAFIQYSHVKEAAQAIKELNGKAFLQRPIAIDWAVPKEQFQGEHPKKIEDETPSADLEEPEQKEEEEDMGTYGDVKEEENEEGAEDEEDEGDEEDVSDGASDDGEDLSDDSGDGSDFDSDDEEPSPKKPRWEKGHDVNENKTLFLRNVSFNSNEEDLRDMMEENFGRVVFAKLVIDKATEHPKGTAFVKFDSEESAHKAIEAAEGKDGLWLDNRQIYASPALKPEDAQTKSNEYKKEKEKKDNRNLFLAREGIVREGTQAAIGVSKTDLQLRTNLEKRKKDMLKNLNCFISPNRLCFRNMPANVTDNALRKLILKHVKSKTKITELRVMKDLKTGKSKGFAFVAFDKDDMALETLRSMNNNPDVFSNDQRPIIEFSIENRKALNARQKRLEKSKEKNPNYNKENKAKEQQKKVKKLDTQEIQDEGEKPRFLGSQSKPGQTKLPTHIGPKIRHKGPKISRKDIKKREKQMKNPKARKAMKESAKSAADTEVSAAAQQIEKPNKAKKSKPKKPKTKAQIKDIREDKGFNKMVSDYKQKLMAAGTSEKGKKRKWFD